jgi:hypothetical protein
MAQNTRCLSTEIVKPCPDFELLQVMPEVREVQVRRPNFVLLP